MTDIFFDKIEKYSKGLGFQDIQVTNFSDFNVYSKHLREFIKNKFYGEMNWIKEKSSIRENPRNIWVEAKSALVFGLNYGPEYSPLSEIKNRTSELEKIYKVIHENPEIGFEEKKTSKLIEQKLKEFGVDEIHTNIAKTGFVAIIKSR